MKSFLTIVSAALALSACTSTSDNGGTGGTGSGGIAIDDLSATFVNQLCAALVDCPSSKGGNGLTVGSLEGCKAILNAEGMGDLSAMVASVKAGKIKYDPASAAECVTAMAKCDAFSSDVEPAACKAAFTGTIADAAACSLREECVSGYCKFTNGCGVCATRGAEGAACEGSSSACADGLFCQSMKCTKMPAPLKVGDDCSTQSCPTGAFCSVSGAGKPVCVAQGDVGAKCNGGSECKSGTYCKPGTSDATCTAVAKAGDPCELLKGMSDPAAPCDAASICIADKDGKGTCKAFVKLGAACGDSLECAGADLVCVDSKCAVLAGKGGACTAPKSMYKPITCLPGLVCSNGVCADAPAIGQPCPLDQCASGASCDNGTCKGKPGNGEPCYGTCASGFYCDMSGSSGAGNCKAISCK